MEVSEIQSFLKLTADGNAGAGTVNAIKAYFKRAYPKIDVSKWPKGRLLLGMEQAIYADSGMETGIIDGLIGEQTRYMRMLWEAKKAEKEDPTNVPNVENFKDIDQKNIVHNDWPYQKDCTKYYGNVGTNQTMLILPFPMKIAWEKKSIVTKFSIHEKVHDSAKRCFDRIADAYDEEARAKLGIDLFGGCLNVRKMRGGSSYSMHSWGIAIDFDPDRNQLRWGRDKARLAKADAETFWKIWEDEGWLSLGRSRNYDWMHVQASRL